MASHVAYVTGETKKHLNTVSSSTKALKEAVHIRTNLINGIGLSTVIILGNNLTAQESEDNQYIIEMINMHTNSMKAERENKEFVKR